MIRRPGRETSMARKSKEDSEDRSDKDLNTQFSDAIWDAAGKIGGHKNGKAVIKESTEGMWLSKDILTFDQFCASPDHMGFPPLSPRQVMPAEYLFGDDPKKMFDTGRDLAVLVWGKGSGKDQIAVLMLLYIVYVLLNLRNPQKFLGVPDNSDIDLLNVAASREQADTVFFHMMKTQVMNWSWIKGRYDIQNSGRLYSASSDKDSQKKITITTDAIIFPHNIRAFSWSSEGETMEGKNLLVYVMDEADAFKAGSDSRNADKIFRICRTSATSRFGKKVKGFVISYPRSQNGFILKLYEKTKTMLSVYSDIGFTWQVKPRQLFSQDTFDFEGHQVPMDFYDDFVLDPIGSKRAYMCMAPLAEQTFFEDPTKIESAINRIPGPMLFEFKDSIKDGFVRKEVTRVPYLPDMSRRYILILDLGIKQDPTALTLMHRENDKIIVDFTTRWIPVEKEKIIVDLMNVEDVIVKIFQSLNVESLYADHWNSPLFLQRLRVKGHKGEIVKVDYEDHEAFKRLVYSGSIVLPNHHALIQELKDLQLYSGKKVDHPEGGHDDMAMTVVMGCKMLLKAGKGENSSNMAAEGEYVGENMHEAIDAFDEKAEGMDEGGLTIEGMQVPFR
jgi:hypothetical protein